MMEGSSPKPYTIPTEGVKRIIVTGALFRSQVLPGESITATVPADAQPDSWEFRLKEGNPNIAYFGPIKGVKVGVVTGRDAHIPDGFPPNDMFGPAAPASLPMVVITVPRADVVVTSAAAEG